MTSIPITSLSILIVDPSMTALQYVEDQLSLLGVNQIYCCDSGAEALQLMRKYRVDLVASAMYLPDMTATGLITAIRKDDRLKDISFMLISTETSFRKLDPVRQAGIIAILPKPFNLDDLRHALAATIRFIDSSNPELDDLHKLEVLVVDDSPLARKHVIRILNNAGIVNILEAENGQVAIELLEENSFDLIVTDYNMPEMDGEQLIRHVREHSQQADIPILMVTSEENKKRLAAVRLAGVSAICDKPFDADAVLQLIRNLIPG